MKANELREGNWIITKPDAPFVQNYIMKVNAYAIANFCEYHDGILITPEVLTACGLTERYCKGEWSWAHCKKEGEWESYTELVETPNGYKFLSAYKLIKYLHELQNLYFALTGEELPYEANDLP